MSRRDQRADPSSAYRRFAGLPGDRMLAVFDVLIDLHVALARAGWVACDLYDGCLVVAPDDRLTVVDLDTYHRGPFTNTMGRMFGSDRFMAPEELTLGASHRPAHHRLHGGEAGHALRHRLTEDLGSYVGTPAGAAVLRRACRPDPVRSLRDGRGARDRLGRRPVAPTARTGARRCPRQRTASKMLSWTPLV